MTRLLLCTVLLLSFVSGVPALAESPNPDQGLALPTGILRSFENVSVTRSTVGFALNPQRAGQPMHLLFAPAQAVGLSREQDQWWVLPLGVPEAPVAGSKPPALPSPTAVTCTDALWVLPPDPSSHDSAWHLQVHGGTLSATASEDGLRVLVSSGQATLTTAEARPHSDPFGNRFTITLSGGGGAALGNTLAAFYWGTMLPSVVEKTMAATLRYSSGYVLSTLNTRAYAGSYPAVDHEFQIKGRLALGSALDLDVVRRMIELQFRLMQDDPEGLSRAPTSVQPNNTREYHIRRNSQDDRENAAMFPVTGNIEVVEESWRYYLATKDRAWLRAHIADLERAAAWTASSIDQYGRLWSDVYYEDQVIKDGRVTQAQCFAAGSFSLLAEMEKLLGRLPQATRYRTLSARLAHALIKPLPLGFWDGTNHRFVDWVDRNSAVHDHLHLLANALPVSFGYATTTQAAAVRQLIHDNDAEYERFPSFLSARIEDYTKSEIGSGGPYDLSAAGRYWFWDATFRAFEHDNALLRRQLDSVAQEGVTNSYFMGERYDMDHVFYVDGKHAHGAEKYYEYPVVYTAVLLNRYLGLNPAQDADLEVFPHLEGFLEVELTQPQYALGYRYDASGFTLKNLASKPRRFTVDLSALPLAGSSLQLTLGTTHRDSNSRLTLTLPARGEAYWARRH